MLEMEVWYGKLQESRMALYVFCKSLLHTILTITSLNTRAPFLLRQGGDLNVNMIWILLGLLFLLFVLPRWIMLLESRDLQDPSGLAQK